MAQNNSTVVDLSAKRVELKGIDLWRSLDESWMERPAPAPHPMLVSGLLPQAKGGMLCGMGKIGKTTAVDDLVFKCAYPSARTDGSRDEWMGSPIADGGAKVILITKESGFDDMTRQFHRMDVSARRTDWRARNGDHQRIKLLPSSMATVLMQSDARGLVRNQAMKDLEDFAGEWFEGRPGLIVLDTLSKLFRINFDNSTSDTSGVADQMDMMAQNTGGTVLGLYHTSKAEKEPESQEKFRYLIKGSAGIVDGLRFALGLWRPWKPLMEIVIASGLASRPSQVRLMGVVAHNVHEMSDAAELPRIMVRDPSAYGSSIDVTNQLRDMVGMQVVNALLAGSMPPKDSAIPCLQSDGGEVVKPKRGPGRPRKDA